MGLFARRRRDNGCRVCGRTESEGCGGAGRHVVEISGEEPRWLPPALRAQAQGEFTYLCTHCNCFPAVKWPTSAGATAGLFIHLGQDHGIGHLAGHDMSDAADEMIRVT